MSQDGHAAGCWDCPCEPWVLTDMDEGIRTVRHNAHDSQCEAEFIEGAYGYTECGCAERWRNTYAQ